MRIVADPATNSLVISAEQGEWEAISALLAELDNEEYDASLQLRVIPLIYADAGSVARAINDAFQGTIERDRRAGRAERSNRAPAPGRPEEQRPSAEVPTVLVESEEWVRASAEPQTNSVIISASRQNMSKIELIIEQLDVADYAQLPPPQLIPVTAGDPAQLAESLRQLYEQSGGGESGQRRLAIVGDQSARTIIVRAEAEEFRQIEALARALQQEAGEQGLSVHVIKVTSAPARRIADAIGEAFQTQAKQANQPLSIEVDVAGNSLIVASTAALAEEIRDDRAAAGRSRSGGGPGHLHHRAQEHLAGRSATGHRDDRPRPAAARRAGLAPARRADQGGSARGRNAVVVVANPADRETIVGLLKAIDAEPELASAQLRVIPLRNAEAAALAAILASVLDPADQQSGSALAAAVAEQVRRLSVRRNGLDEPDVQLDLTVPIRIVAEPQLNALVISSSEANVKALADVVTLFDALPITDAVTVQLFPLENIAADQFARIVNELFTQGKRLGQVPGTDLRGIPAGMVGKALLDEVALAVDERTNTVVVAGKEDAVALVEVLTKRLDSDVATGWVEPRIIPLRYADAETLSRLLQEVLVEGSTDLPQSTPLQRQIARLRMARADGNGGQVLESDVFQPMNRLFIRAEPQLNAIVLVGTPMNLEVVSELIDMLDVEAASPSAAVRIYPIEHASAERLARTITELFDQQIQSKAIRPEDRVIVQADERTNALIVTTSPRSFAVLESLLQMLDTEIAPDLREIRSIELTTRRRRGWRR